MLNHTKNRTLCHVLNNNGLCLNNTRLSMHSYTVRITISSTGGYVRLVSNLQSYELLLKLPVLTHSYAINKSSCIENMWPNNIQLQASHLIHVETENISWFLW